MRLLLVGWLVLGCGGESTPIDANHGGPEVTPHPGSDIGDPCSLTGGACGDDMGTCTSPTDICIASSCDELFVGGYCSQKCGSDNPINPNCPADATCVANGQQGNAPRRCLRKCATDADCRPGGYVCLPVIEGGRVCAPGLGCTQAPTSGLESPDFQHPNLLVPTDTASSFEAEGNVTSDGAGHVAMSQIAVYPGFGGDGMVVATYDEATAMFGGTVKVIKDMDPNSVETSDPVVAYDRTAGGLYLTWIEVGSTNPWYVYVSKSMDHGATWSTLWRCRAPTGATSWTNRGLPRPAAKSGSPG